MRVHQSQLSRHRHRKVWRAADIHFGTGEDVFVQGDGSLNDVLGITRLPELPDLGERLLDEGNLVINDVLALHRSGRASLRIRELHGRALQLPQ